MDFFHSFIAKGGEKRVIKSKPCRKTKKTEKTFKKGVDKEGRKRYNRRADLRRGQETPD